MGERCLNADADAVSTWTQTNSVVGRQYLHVCHREPWSARACITLLTWSPLHPPVGDPTCAACTKRCSFSRSADAAGSTSLVLFLLSLSPALYLSLLPSLVKLQLATASKRPWPTRDLVAAAPCSRVPPPLGWAARGLPDMHSRSPSSDSAEVPAAFAVVPEFVRGQHPIPLRSSAKSSCAARNLDGPRCLIPAPRGPELDARPARLAVSGCAGCTPLRPPRRAVDDSPAACCPLPPLPLSPLPPPRRAPHPWPPSTVARAPDAGERRHTAPCTCAPAFCLNHFRLAVSSVSLLCL